jgi:hypothetical protein
MKPNEVLELDREVSGHVDKNGHGCNGKTFDLQVAEVNNKDASFGTLIQCQTCLRDLSLENERVFDPYPPKRQR